MSAQRDKGTRFETDVVRYMRRELGDTRIERRALHGSRDMGDIFGIRAHGYSGIAECKCHRTVTDGLVERWRDQTLMERGNADADFALLIVSAYRKPVARSEVHVTLRDLSRIGLELMLTDERYRARADETWAVLTLRDACALIGAR